MQNRGLERSSSEGHLFCYQQCTDGKEQHGDDADDFVERIHDVGACTAKHLRGIVDLRRIIVCADRRHARTTASGTHEAARHESVARLLRDEVRLAGEQAFVCAAPSRDDLAVRWNLVSAAELDDVVEDDFAQRNVLQLAIADDVRFRRCDNAQAVDGEFAADLLENADDDVAENNREENQVAVRTGPENRDRQNDIDEIEQRADVVAEDARYGARFDVGVFVDLAFGNALRHLRVGQTARACRRVHCCPVCCYRLFAHDVA